MTNADLDWRTHRLGPLRPCVICSGRAVMRDEDGRPCHKVCAERGSSLAPHLRTSTPKPEPRPTSADCLHVKCQRPATWLLVPKYGRPSAWCGRHVGPVEAAARDVERRRLPARRRR